MLRRVYNTIKRHLNVLINEARNIGMNSNPMEEIKAKKTKAKLHKPYNDISSYLTRLSCLMITCICVV